MATKYHGYQNFDNNQKEARKDEHVCALLVKELFPDYKVAEVGDIKKFRHRGDIVAHSDKDDKTIYFEVKTDNVFAGRTGTQNAFAEEEVTFFKKSGAETINGYMCFDEDYQIVFLHSRRTSEIVVIDFARWKYGYRKHFLHPSNITISHPEQHPPSESVGVMNPLGNMEMEGVIYGWITYDWSGKYFGSPDCKAWIVDTQENPKYHATDSVWEKRLSNAA